MDLTLEDVSKIVNKSVDELRRLVEAGELSAYKLGGEYRFAREEIETLALNANDSGRNTTHGTSHFSFFRAIHRGGVYTSEASVDKETLIHQTIANVTPDFGLDSDEIADLFIRREALMSTAIGSGIAIPHARELLLEEPENRIVVVFLKDEMEFGALDGKRVHTLFFLFSSSDAMHLQLLSKIAHFASEEENIAYLRTKPMSDELLHYVKNWERK